VFDIRKYWNKKHWNRQTIPSLIGAVVLGAVVASVIWGVAESAGGSAEPAAGSTPSASRTDSARPTSTPTPTPTVGAAADGTSCSGGTTVRTATELEAALAAATPGTSIILAPGVYTGNFVATASGTATDPISLCGSTASILDGGDLSKGYVFHLDGASYWHLQGFTVQNGQKGVMADGTVGSVIEGLTVTQIGEEGIHLRKDSTDNTVTGNTVNHTGVYKAKFGEGIYIGTAQSNWCDITACKPDNSDRNIIENNVISDTGAENVDIKEGTTGGILRGNSFDGTGMTGADSWVDVKGNGWTIDDNRGVNSPNDGFQTHQILDGWGTDNVFSNNTAAVNGPGYGIASRPALGNIVECNNTVTGAASGVSNIPCTN
jgi:parallel beta-helix repeat protein